MAEQKKQGGKNRKYGRNGRSPSMQRYNIERRWVKNGAKRLARHLKQVEKKRIKLLNRAARAARMGAQS